MRNAEDRHRVVLPEHVEDPAPEKAVALVVVPADLAVDSVVALVADLVVLAVAADPVAALVDLAGAEADPILDSLS